MSAIREKLIDYINMIPEYKLTPLEPLLEFLSDEMYIEKVGFDDLDEDEKEAVIQGRAEYARNPDSFVPLDSIN